MILNGQASEAISQAAQALRQGELVGLPTETVYGLAADADNPAAVARIFAAKGRPSDHPLIVHLASAEQAPHYAQYLPDFARVLMQAFWPGPLTLILPRRPEAAAVAAGGQDSIGLRCPSHPVAQALLQAAAALGVSGVAAPSANRFGRISPTTAQHVAGEFDPALLILDGGPCTVGIESTIIDCSRGVPVLLRPGLITPDQIAAVAGLDVLDPATLASASPRASGTLEAHYAPRARLRLLPGEQLQHLLGSDAAELGSGWLGVLARFPQPVVAGRARVHWRLMPADAAAAAQQLFATLRELDALGVSQIWVEAPPPGWAWDGVRDRLQRAAAAG